MKNLVKAMKALSDETRLRMLNLLLQRECCVCEVMQVMGISQTRASRNLTQLYEAGFLKLRKVGLWSHYSVDKAALKEYAVSLVEAVEAGLKDDPIALQDIANLLGTDRLSTTCCQTSEGKGV